MSKKQQDLRVIRTKKLIKEALLTLIEKQGFDSITVKDIAKQAEINRGTFYSHYEDKYDLMNAYIDEIFEEVEEKLIKNLQRLFHQENPTGFPPDAYRVLVPFSEFLQRNRVIMKSLLGPTGDPHFQSRLKQFMHDALFKRASGSLFLRQKALVPSDYLISYIASAHIGVMQEWLIQDRDESPEEIAKIIFTITTQGPLRAGGLM